MSRSPGMAESNLAARPGTLPGRSSVSLWLAVLRFSAMANTAPPALLPIAGAASCRERDVGTCGYGSAGASDRASAG